MTSVTCLCASSSTMVGVGIPVRGAPAVTGRCDGRMEDFEAIHDRPFNWRPVWIGYDLSHTGEAQAVRYCSPPLVAR